MADVAAAVDTAAADAVAVDTAAADAVAADTAAADAVAAVEATAAADAAVADAAAATNSDNLKSFLNKNIELIRPKELLITLNILC
jgi:hypothetical protein